MPSVPNVLTTVNDWAELGAAAEKRRARLTNLVIQTPYGDSGKTTFFISSEADWKRHSAGHRRPGGQGDEAGSTTARWRSRPC